MWRAVSVTARGDGRNRRSTSERPRSQKTSQWNYNSCRPSICPGLQISTDGGELLTAPENCVSSSSKAARSGPTANKLFISKLNINRRVRLFVTAAPRVEASTFPRSNRQFVFPTKRKEAAGIKSITSGSLLTHIHYNTWCGHISQSCLCLYGLWIISGDEDLVLFIAVWLRCGCLWLKFLHLWRDDKTVKVSHLSHDRSKESCRNIWDILSQSASPSDRAISCGLMWAGAS